MKLGLALSGGGFRASFFHLGVLARMAELGLLRHVEVLSCVSGGAILGALYYVHLKRLLETKADADVGDDDYVRVLERIERDFLAAVQTNIRMRTFVNPLKNIRMTWPDYSRSDRIGELYDRLLYRPALAPGRERMVEMRELKIFPFLDRSDFYPRAHNAERRAKVPILLLNATTLNTGHNWRFEASTMGAPAASTPAELDVDKNARLLRPASYADVVPRQQNVELGLAVAASAGVPGGFPPLALSGLYAGFRVELVDGGVHDNQGVRGLLDEQCTHVIVSDASGQLEDVPTPATRTLPVLTRTNDVLMDRVREEELLDLLRQRPTPTAFLHLRKELAVATVPYIDRTGRPAPALGTPSTQRTSYGVDVRVQDRLSRVRTDLDSFTDVEAFSLMLDGYLMSEAEVTSVLGQAFREARPAPGRWRFLAARGLAAQPTVAYLRQLEVARRKLFKVFRLSPLTTAVTLLAALVLLGVGGWWQWPALVRLWRAPISVGTLVTAAILLALGFIPRLSRTAPWLEFLRSPTEYVLRFVARGLLPALGAVFVWLYLQVFDRLFLRLGRLERVR
jgi:NTE family protein